ncbi:MAG: NFACT family protein [Candidatus Thermoplasmatota archaeon]|nr:NFACT family protein [Candidatus Thermoplasmatota archaeon]
MQKQLSSFDIYVIVNELKNLKDGYIEKIYQLSHDEILIKIKNINTKEKEQIFIRNGELICLSDKDFETPEKPSSFAMALRKYLMNGRIIDIVQHEFDRIIKIIIGKKEGNYILVCEFFSKGNIILVNPDGNIIVPLVRETWAYRKVKGREQYLLPPSQLNPFILSFDEFKKRFKESTSDIVRTLAVSINLSGGIAEEICIRSNIDKKTLVENVNDKTLSNIFENIQSFLGMFKDKNFQPVLVKKDETIVDILPFKFEKYNDASFEKIDNFCKGLSFFITKKEVKSEKDTHFDKILGKLERQLLQQKEATVIIQKQIDEKKREGDLIYLHYQEIEALLSEIKGVFILKEKDEKIKEINNKNIVKIFDPEEKLLILNLSDTTGKIFEVKISFRISVSENAEKAYDDNKKLKSKLAGAEKSIKNTLEEIDKIKKRKKINEKEPEKQPVKNKKIFWFENYRWFICSNANLVIGGRDAKTNDKIVKKYLTEGDRYAHADVQGAPSIIIKNKNISDKEIQITDNILEEACIYAASFSKAWKQFVEASAYWVLPEQVSKTPQSGEFVPHGAFIIRGKRNYYRCKLELAVGEIELDNTKKIMCGPISAIKKWSKKYVVLVPGDTTKIDIAKRLSRLFDVNVDEVDRVIPAGGSKIIDNIGVKL